MLHAIALNCTLKRSGQPSSTSLLLSQVGQAMKAHQIGFEEVRIADQKRMPSYGRVATVAVVGNEDGAHHVAAEMFQALNDVGFTLAANAMTYWVGEAMKGTDYKDLSETPGTTANATAMMVRNAVHLARQLRQAGYPGESKQ